MFCYALTSDESLEDSPRPLLPIFRLFAAAEESGAKSVGVIVVEGDRGEDIDIPLLPAPPSREHRLLVAWRRSRCGTAKGEDAEGAA